MFTKPLRRPRINKARHTFSRSSKLGFENLERRDLLSAGPPKVVNVEVIGTEWSTAFIGYLQAAELGINGYSIPVGSSSQTATLPWTNINRIAITFDEDVDVQAADLSLSGVNTVASAFSDFRYDPQSHVAIWTLGAPVTKDRFRLDLDANVGDPVKDLDGNELDGEWTNNTSTFPSGNGVADGDFEFSFNVLPADIDNTGVVTYYDYYYTNLLNGLSTSSPGYIALRDLDGSGLIDSTDSQAVMNRLAHQLPTGSPAGTNNDAPSTLGFSLLQINNAAIDHAIAMWPLFRDDASRSNYLNYSIQSNSEPTLFDDVHINTSNGNLILNSVAGVSGRARIVIRATDAGGLFTESTATIDVNRVNLAPIISDVSVSNIGGGTYIFEGTITDSDDDVFYFTVDFWGVYVTRSGVDEDGHFEIALSVPDGTWGWEFLTTFDPHGLQSNVVSRLIGLT